MLKITANPNGTLRILDKRNNKQFDQMLTIEERADIGNGWFHGIAVNDQIISSAGAQAEVALIGDGRYRSTLRISLVLNVPERFNFTEMRRAERTTPLRIVSDVTLRESSSRIEVTTVVHNTVEDHRIRVLFPTCLHGDTFEADSVFDVVEHPISRIADNDTRRELELETKAQASWSAFGDGETGLAIVARGLPEVAVPDNSDRAIALTLLRGFRKVITQDDDTGGQVLGTHTFRYDIVPFAGATPTKRLFILGQRLHSTVRQASIAKPIVAPVPAAARLPRSKSFAKVTGEAIVTSLQRSGSARLLRVFNPTEREQSIAVAEVAAVEAVQMNGKSAALVRIKLDHENANVTIKPKQILQMRVEPKLRVHARHD